MTNKIDYDCFGATVHAIQRAKERYNLDLKPWEIIRLENWVRDGKCKKVRKRPGKRVHFCVLYREKLLHFIYIRGVGKIVTFLPSHGH